MKKWVFVILIIVGVLSVLYYFFFRKYETYPYEVVKKYSNFEIRKYEAALFTSVDLNSVDYQSTSSQGFRILAGYIFGGNESNEKIAMTTPVLMNIKEESTKMQFLVPTKYSEASLPKPNNTTIQFEQQPPRTVAVIRFGGWSNDNKIKEYRQKLEVALAKQGLSHKGGYTYMGYNAPFDFIGRRNEIMVELL
jgi:hypothetical protein